MADGFGRMVAGGMKTGFSRKFSKRLAGVSSSGSGGGGSGGGGESGGGPGRGRGKHANSRANLALAPGGDRMAGKRLIIEAIETALRDMPNGREIRVFFGLGPEKLLKEKHRAKWAKAKAPIVYAAMVQAMATAAAGQNQWIMPEISPERRAEIYAGITQAEIARWGSRKIAAVAKESEEKQRIGREVDNSKGLRIGGFMEALAVPEKKLYPVVAGKSAPVSEAQLDYVSVSLAGFSDYFGVLPTAYKYGEQQEAVKRLDYPNGAGRPVVTALGTIRAKSTVNYSLLFEGSGQAETREIDAWSRWVWVLMVMPDNNYWVPAGEIYGRPMTIVRHIETFEDWRDTALSIDPHSLEGQFESVYQSALDVEGWNEAVAAKPDPWAFEFPVLGQGQGGDVPYIASLFPRRQRVYGVIDPNGNVSYGDIEYVDWETWEAHLGANRGPYIAQGMIVPPQICPAPRANLSVTFASEFLDGIQPEWPSGGAP